MNPILLYDNRFKDGPITATDTAPGYDVSNIADERPYKLWMGASGGTKELVVDCGGERPANALGLYRHNLATVGAKIAVETSPDNAAWTRRMGRRLASFSRPSPAYLSDGTQVASGQPRYETGKYGKAIMIEKSTSNLLTANQASVETDLTGFFAAGNHSMVRTLSDYVHGSASLEVTATAAGGSDNNIRLSPVSITNGIQYTVSFYAKSISGNSVLHTEFFGGIGAQSVQLTTQWQRFTVLLTASTSAAWYFWLDGAGTFRLDSLQIEQMPFATSWHNPADGARADESPSFPTTGIISPFEGAIACWMNVNAVSKRQITGAYPRIFHIRNGGGGQGVSLHHRPDSANWEVGTNGVTSISAPDSYTPNGWHHFAVSWSASTLKLYIDGVLRTSVASPSLASTFATNMYIGMIDGSSIDHINTTIDDLQTFNRAPSDSEVAALYSGGNAALEDNSNVVFPFDDTLYSLSVVPGSDFSHLMIFPEAQGRYWKLVLEDCVETPYLAYAAIGQKIEFPYPPDAPYVPYRQRTKGKTSLTDDDANPIEVVIDHKRIEIDARFSNVSRDFVFGAAGTGWGAFLFGGAAWGSGPTFQDFIESHGSDLRWFFWVWDMENFPRHVFFVKLRGEADYETPLSMLAYVDEIALKMEGVLEW